MSNSTFLLFIASVVFAGLCFVIRYYMDEHASWFMKAAMVIMCLLGVFTAFFILVSAVFVQISNAGIVP